jgi:hypothetical protein
MPIPLAPWSNRSSCQSSGIAGLGLGLGLLFGLLFGLGLGLGLGVRSDTSKNLPHFFCQIRESKKSRAREGI